MKKVNGFQALTIFAKRPVLDVWQCFEYTSGFYSAFESRKVEKRMQKVPPRDWVIWRGWVRSQRQWKWDHWWCTGLRWAWQCAIPPRKWKIFDFIETCYYIGGLLNTRKVFMLWFINLIAFVYYSFHKLEPRAAHVFFSRPVVWPKKRWKKQEHWTGTDK